MKKRKTANNIQEVEPVYFHYLCRNHLIKITSIGDENIYFTDILFPGSFFTKCYPCENFKSYLLNYNN